MLTISAYKAEVVVVGGGGGWGGCDRGGGGAKRTLRGQACRHHALQYPPYPLYPPVCERGIHTYIYTYKRPGPAPIGTNVISTMHEPLLLCA